MLYVSIRPVVITTGRIETYQIATYSIRTLLKVDYWSPKHVELLNVMNKITYQILCILLDYRYITRLVLRVLYKSRQPYQFLCWVFVFQFFSVYRKTAHYYFGISQDLNLILAKLILSSIFIQNHVRWEHKVLSRSSFWQIILKAAQD